jgi:hypothetical protein
MQIRIAMIMNTWMHACPQTLILTSFVPTDFRDFHPSFLSFWLLLARYLHPNTELNGTELATEEDLIKARQQVRPKRRVTVDIQTNTKINILIFF